ncbi:MAG: DUF4126 domain-containing protein [Holophagales bacterium]|nr:DUF4126 domain-containing protein [Holophagales bacterium]
MEVLLSISVGLGLAAACGFRIFVPLLLISIAHRTGHLSLAEGFEWMASTPAMITFGVATLFEICAYYVPFFDNLLDTLATPSAVVAGVVATASQVGELDPWLTWSVAIIGGGGGAGLVQGLTTVTRQISSLATAGFGNPLVSTAEAGLSIGMTILAIVAPLVAVAALLVGLAYGARKLLARRATAGQELTAGG